MHFGPGACEPVSTRCCMSETDLERRSSTRFGDYQSPLRSANDIALCSARSSPGLPR